tara:strand:+ start:485 stop:676 length:192 start_codon:yes stop_codon:yes gene_type:complete
MIMDKPSLLIAPTLGQVSGWEEKEKTEKDNDKPLTNSASLDFNFIVYGSLRYKNTTEKGYQGV